MPRERITDLTAQKEENLLDYIRWIGGMDFTACPFREADALVLCVLSYFDLTMLLPGALEVRVSDLLPYIEKKLSRPQLTKNSEISADIAIEACRSKRFGELFIRDYEDVLQEEPPLQFAAMSFHDGGDMHFLAYRGTDSSLTGWKEDCMIGFTRTEAQQRAEAYAHRVISQEASWRMGGHSKGGNQVLYAAAHLSDEELEKVERIYMLDGPGFCPEIIGGEAVARIEPKITRIIPEFDMIGKLFEPHISDTRIIKSANPEGMGQHTLASWLVDHGELSAGIPNERAERMMKIVNEWIGDLSLEERKIFVDELFAALESDGSTRLSEISAERFGNVLIELNRTSKVTKKIFAELPKSILREELPDKKEDRGMTLLEKAVKADAGIGAVLVMFGLILCLANENMLDLAALLAMGIVTLYQIHGTVRRLKKRKGASAGVRERIYMTIALLVVFTVLLLKENAAFLMGSLIFGTLLLVVAYREGLYASKARKAVQKVFFWAEAGACTLLGFAFLLTPQGAVKGLSLTLGILMIADGLARLLYLFVIRKKKK